MKVSFCKMGLNKSLCFDFSLCHRKFDEINSFRIDFYLFRILVPVWKVRHCQPTSKTKTGLGKKKKNITVRYRNIKEGVNFSLAPDWF